MNDYLQMTIDMLGESSNKPPIIDISESGGGKTQNPR